MGLFQLFKPNKNKGVYLSEDQIKKLEQRIELPSVSTPVFLHANEVAVYYSQATRQETKNRVVGRTSNYGGGSVRIAKGLSVHTGGGSSRTIYGDVATQYPGELVITNERVIFISNQKAFELSHNNITAATAYQDGSSFQSKNTSYVLLIPRPDLAVIAFDGVRIGDVPIAGSYIVAPQTIPNSKKVTQKSAAEHAELATNNLRTMAATFDFGEFLQAYKKALYHQEQVTIFWRSQGGDPDSEELLESLIAEKEDYINEFFARCYNEGVLQQLKDRIMQHATELTSGNVQYLEDLLSGNFDVADSGDDEAVAREACSRLKKNLRVDMAFWEEMHLDFKCNLVTSYDQLQLNYEIKNTSGVPWYSGGGGIEIKANVYNAEGELLCIEDDYIDDDDISKRRYSSFILFHIDNLKEAAYIEIYAYQEN